MLQAKQDKILYTNLLNNIILSVMLYTIEKWVITMKEEQQLVTAWRAMERHALEYQWVSTSKVR